MVKPRCRLLVVHGAMKVTERPDEADTLDQAAAVCFALRRRGFAARIVALADETAARAFFARTRPDLVFNLVETWCGEGRFAPLLPRLLDDLRIPHTGCRHAALAATSSKTEAKRVMREHGVPTPAWSIDGKGFPPAVSVIVKPVWEDASVGIDTGSVVDGAAAARALTSRRAAMGGAWFAERYIEGREFNVSILDGPLGPQVLPPAEILFVDFPAGRPRIVDYDAKWDAAGFAYHHTPRRFGIAAEDPKLARRLNEVALACWFAFELSGYARVDIRIDARGRLFVLEVNGNPCLSADAGFVAAAAEAGLGFDTVIARIVDAALPGMSAFEAA